MNVTTTYSLLASVIREVMTLVRLDIEATAGPRDKLRLFAWRMFTFMALVLCLSLSNRVLDFHSKNKLLTAQLASLTESCPADQSKNQSGTSSDSPQSGQGLKIPASLHTTSNPITYSDMRHLTMSP